MRERGAQRVSTSISAKNEKWYDEDEPPHGSMAEIYGPGEMANPDHKLRLHPLSIGELKAGAGTVQLYLSGRAFLIRASLRAPAKDFHIAFSREQPLAQMRRSDVIAAVFLLLALLAGASMGSVARHGLGFELQRNSQQ